MERNRRKLTNREVGYFDFEQSDYVRGRVDQVNGSLAYVVDDRTGKGDWRDRQELDLES